MSLARSAARPSNPGRAPMPRIPSTTRSARPSSPRAASALASVVVGELRRRTGGVYGRRVVLLVGPGSNGGDASWAGARLAARGVRVDAVLTSGRVHGGGLE